jgi:hypothetical protein
MPPKHEIFFRDRDYHNFTRRNLELLSKSAVHRRTFELGETRLVSAEERKRMVLTRWNRFEARAVGSLLDQFNRGEKSLLHSFAEPST